jgi:hypothetical protein
MENGRRGAALGTRRLMEELSDSGKGLNSGRAVQLDSRLPWPISVTLWGAYRWRDLRQFKRHVYMLHTTPDDISGGER